MKTATPEQVQNYLRQVVGNDSMRESLNVSLNQAKSRASSLLVERSVQELEPADYLSKTTDEQNEWTKEADVRIGQYDNALQECANVIAMLEKQLETLGPEPGLSSLEEDVPATLPPKVNRGERRRRDKVVAKAIEEKGY